MSLVQFIAIAISLVAVSIAAHTKYKQFQQKTLRGLSQELSEIQDATGALLSELENPRSHEDVKHDLDKMPKDILGLSYDINADDVTIAISITSGIGKDADKICYPENGLNELKDTNSVLCQVVIGNLEKLSGLEDRYYLHLPASYMSYIYRDMEQVEKEYENEIGEFDDEILNELKMLVESIAKSSLENIIKKDPINMNLNNHESTKEIEEHICGEIYNYNGLEEDIEELNEKIEELDELRKIILQASYS